ncbi:MAG: nucleotidyl transferase AbiEii/AbiGii toxin family protein [Actinomycetes bacterium]
MAITNSGQAGPPADRSHMERLITAWANEENVAGGRVRRSIMVAVVMSMLYSVEPHGNVASFVVKGGSAMDLRFGWGARTSKDLDSVFRGNLDDAVGEVRTAVEREWQGFTGTVVGVETIEIPGLRIKPLRCQVKLLFKGRAFGTLPMEISAPEGKSLDEVDVVSVRPFQQVRLSPISEVDCLQVPYQIAQKLHACTDPLDGTQENVRVQDIADLILLETLVPDDGLASVRQACVDIFEGRDNHQWPPTIRAGASWSALWERLVDNGEAPFEDLADAITAVQGFVRGIDETG